MKYRRICTQPLCRGQGKSRRSAIGIVAAPILRKKTFPTVGRGCLFAARFWVSGDFQGLCMEIMQV